MKTSVNLSLNISSCIFFSLIILEISKFKILGLLDRPYQMEDIYNDVTNITVFLRCLPMLGMSNNINCAIFIFVKPKYSSNLIKKSLTVDISKQCNTICLFVSGKLQMSHKSEDDILICLSLTLFGRIPCKYLNKVSLVLMGMHLKLILFQMFFQLLNWYLSWIFGGLYFNKIYSKYILQNKRNDISMN